MIYETKRMTQTPDLVQQKMGRTNMEIDCRQKTNMGFDLKNNKKGYCYRTKILLK